MNLIFSLTSLPRALVASATLFFVSACHPHHSSAADHGDHHEHGSSSGEKSAGHGSGTEVTVTGEVLDMACYIGHEGMGPDHADCAKTCIESGVPVGLKGTDGKTYLLIGEHKPANKELAKYAAKTITVRGKLTSRDGVNMISNIEIVKN